MPSRPTPLDLIWEPFSQANFPGVRTALELARHDPRDRDAFLMQREIVTLLHELRPHGGLGEGIDQLAALVHHAYLFWDAGSRTFELPESRLPEVLGPAWEWREEIPEQPAYYVQAPERRIWAQVVPGQPHEPLDGCFVHSLSDAEVLRVLGVFGIYPDRTGFSVVEVSGPRPAASYRADGSVLFTPVLPGGPAARLFSIVEEEELLVLGWRSRALAVGSLVESSRWRA